MAAVSESVAGYVLVHVLEVVHGRDLSDVSCELTLADATARCPVPSTLEGENILLPMGGTEPVIHVHARDSVGNSVGLVVVPVSELVPLEVWDVWYAMDDGSNDMDEKPPEETPKMHLLLQSVPPEAAEQETKQGRDVRAQDFLLRALQQLNAALEAKVLEQAPGGNPLSGHSASAPSTGASRPAATSGSAGSGSGSRRGAGRSGERSGERSGDLRPLRAAGALGPRRPPGVGNHTPQQSARVQEAVAAAPLPELSNGISPEEKEEKQRAQEEAFKLRLEPYERAIAALEQKQRLYDDQEARILALSTALEEQQGRSGHLVAQLREEADRAKMEAEQERESLREVTTSRTTAQQRAAELEQEVALRRSHEESLQHRLSLLEAQVSAASQKSLAAQAVEEEAQKALAEVEGLRKQRQRLQEQLQEQSKELSEAREENWQLKEDRGREIEKARAISEREILAKETLQLEVLQLQDQLRDKEAETRLALERAEGSQRRVETLQAEVSSLQSLLARERQHRAELDQKLNETEIQKLHSTLDEHRVLVRGLRLDLEKARQELSEERGRSNTMETEMAAAKKELVRGQRQLEELRGQSLAQEDLREELRSLSERNEALREQLRSLHQETRKVTERVDREVSGHVEAQRSAIEANEAKLADMSEIRRKLASASSQVQELQTLKEQTERALEASKKSTNRTEDLARQLHQLQEDLGSSLRERNQLHEAVERATVQFREDVFKQSQRHLELEGMLEDRNNEIKLLMYRLQELSSRYVPVKADATDMVLSRWINGYRPAVPFFRLAQGLYLFGRRQVVCKISNDKPVFRIGGGFIGFEKFLEQFAAEELERLLTYELDEKTGEPKFLLAKQALEESGLVEDLRQKVSEDAQRSKPAGLQSSMSRRSLNSSRGSL